MALEPLEQRAAQSGSTTGRNRGRRALEQRAIDVVHVLREDVVEVADRLMQMEAEREPDRRHALSRRRGSASRPAPRRCAGSTSGKSSSRSASSAARRWPRSSASAEPSTSAVDQLLGVAAVLAEPPLAVVRRRAGRDDELPVGRLGQQQLARGLRQDRAGCRRRQRVGADVPEALPPAARAAPRSRRSGR